MSITNKRLTEIQARLNAATDGPWAVDDDDPEYIVFPEKGGYDGLVIAKVVDQDGALFPVEHNGQFIAHAPTDIADLLDEIERLRALTTITKDRVRAAGREFWLSGAKDRAWAEAAWDDMGGGEPCAERALIEIAAERALEAALKETK